MGWAQLPLPLLITCARGVSRLQNHHADNHRITRHVENAAYNCWMSREPQPRNCTGLARGITLLVPRVYKRHCRSVRAAVSQRWDQPLDSVAKRTTSHVCDAPSVIVVSTRGVSARPLLVARSCVSVAERKPSWSRRWALAWAYESDAQR